MVDTKQQSKAFEKDEPRSEREGFFDDAAEHPGEFIPAGPNFINELNNKELGAIGEIIAVSFLENLGFDVIEKNYRCPEGEADIVAHHDGELVFIEVKTRRRRNVDDIDGFPEEAVNSKKQKRYRRIASHYVREIGDRHPVRFDAVGVFIVDGEHAQISHVPYAFDWDLGAK